MRPLGLKIGRRRVAVPLSLPLKWRRGDKEAPEAIPAPLGLSRWSEAHPALSAALDLTSDAVYFASCDTRRIFAANAAAIARTGYESDELLGMELSDVVKTADGFERSVRDGEPSPLGTTASRGTHHAKGGACAPADIRFQRIEAGGEALLVAAVRDILPPMADRAEALLDAGDPLTALPNRARLTSCLRGIERRKNHDTFPIALLFVDVDLFKEINDTHGHLAGDRVLQMIAHRLLCCVRPDDVVVRYGGDEFVVLLHGIKGEAEVNQIVERIGAEIEQPIELDDGEVAVTASIGVSIGSDAESVGELLDEADRAMYRVKRARRNRPR